jgi:stage II sporulation SpoE-like protein/GAF domain-containing protein
MVSRYQPLSRRSMLRADGADREGETRAAVLSAAALYVVGASLTGTAALLPEVGSATGVKLVAAAALVTAAALLVAVWRWQGGLGLAFAADLWGVLLVALLCASTGGARSPFALIYFFAIGHAAAFQPRARLAAVSCAALVGFLTPLAYEHVSTMFASGAAVGMVLALLTGGAVHYATNLMRAQRRLLESLVTATSGLDSSLDPAATAGRIARTAVPHLAELCMVHLADHPESSPSTVAAASDPEVAAEVERLAAQSPLRLDGENPVTRVLRGDAPYVIEQPAAGVEDAAAGDGDLRELMRESGFRSVAVFPMIARGRTHGAISFVHSERWSRRAPDHLAILGDLAARAAVAYDNARLYAERGRVADTLRRSLMPRELPAVPGIELASFFRPTGAGEELGGDFYDVFAREHRCWLVVGDVCGKGAEAAAVTGFLRHTTMAYAREASSPAWVLAHVNEAMLEQDFGGRFATVLLAHIETLGARIEVRIATAGHPPALLARAGGSVEEAGRCGTLLGVFADPAIHDVTVLLEPGDTLALYTDGLVDAHAPGRRVGARELLEALARTSPASAPGAVAALLGLVDLDGGVRDDIAILAARVKTRVVSDRPLGPIRSGASGVPKPLLRAAAADAPDD